MFCIKLRQKQFATCTFVKRTKPEGVKILTRNNQFNLRSSNEKYVRYINENSSTFNLFLLRHGRHWDDQTTNVRNTNINSSVESTILLKLARIIQPMPIRDSSFVNFCECIYIIIQFKRSDAKIIERYSHQRVRTNNRIQCLVFRNFYALINNT